MANGYTIVEYKYVDAGNYKVFGEILLSGQFSDTEEQILYRCLIDQEFFIPDLVGIFPLQSELWDEYSGANDDDHEWHSICSIRRTNGLHDKNQPSPLWGDTNKFLKNFIVASQQKWARQNMK